MRRKTERGKTEEGRKEERVEERSVTPDILYFNIGESQGRTEREG